MEKIKATLHAHPHFYSPGHSKAIHESFYRIFFPIPNLRTIVESAFEKDIGIYALSSCHTPTSGTDNRFKDYMAELPELERKFEIDPHLDQGWVAIAKKEKTQGLPHIILLHTQEVRTRHGNGYTDVNVIGSGNIINYEKTLEEVCDEQKDIGNITVLCHPNAGACSSGLETAWKLYDSGKVTTIEEWNASIPEKSNEETQEFLMGRRIKGIAVSDSHHYKQSDKSYILINKGLLENFSIEDLRRIICNGSFDNQYGQISRLERFATHELPILTSIPFHLASKPSAIIKSLISRKK
ncbi:hypothetical protein J4477_02425 [Candidatus Pacearchaeota archaeon]|nr:hypothetical protein [Candidatus Pacearchaeota archaeon]